MSAVEDLRGALEGAGVIVPAERLTEALSTAGLFVIAPGDIFGPTQAADYLGIDRTTLARWNRDGYLPKPLQRVGGADAWTREALDAFREHHDGVRDAAGRRPLGTAR
jgi:predicted DNA-binding transcriptional regulator AlpA